MTFGALAVWQAWLLVAAAAGLAAWLFLLKLRPPRILVSSLLLWRRVLDESRETTLWERIRRAVSLIATIAIAVALALSVARPARTAGATAAAPRQRLLIVLDSSWSMRARTKGGETRWDRAVAEARRLAASSGGDEVALATTAEGLVEGPTPDPALIDAALDRLTPAGGEGSSWPTIAGAAAVHFITDGSLARQLEPGVIVHSVFEAAPNVAITAFDVRPALSGKSAADLYVEVANFADASQTVHLSLTRAASTVLDRRIEVAAGESIRQIVPLDAQGDRRLVGRVEADRDALAADNEALAWIDRAQPLAVTVVGDDTRWLSALFSQNSDVRATFIRPADYRPGQEDVTIFDQYTPPDPPARPSVLVAPPTSRWLAMAGQEERRPRWSTPGTHPVVQGVDPLTMSIEKARAYDSPAALMPVAQSAAGTPLVYVQQSASARLVIVTFGHTESNLAFAPGLPVLVGNALDWLSRPESGAARSPGPMLLDEPDVTLRSQNGRAVPVLHVGRSTVGLPSVPGLYTAESGGARSTIAVNVGNPEVSNLGRTNLSAIQRAQTVASGASHRPLWLYCALAAFALGLVEWWTWQRRITV